MSNEDMKTKIKDLKTVIEIYQEKINEIEDIAKKGLYNSKYDEYCCLQDIENEIKVINNEIFNNITFDTRLELL